MPPHPFSVSQHALNIEHERWSLQRFQFHFSQAIITQGKEFADCGNKDLRRGLLTFSFHGQIEFSSGRRN
jgi:hypothetical protein